MITNIKSAQGVQLRKYLPQRRYSFLFLFLLPSLLHSLLSSFFLFFLLKGLLSYFYVLVGQHTVHLNEVVCIEFNKKDINKGVGWDKDTNKRQYKILGLSHKGEPSLPLGLKGRRSEKITRTQEGELNGEGLLRCTLAFKRGTQTVHSSLTHFQTLFSSCLPVSSRDLPQAHTAGSRYKSGSQGTKPGGGEEWHGGDKQRTHSPAGSGVHLEIRTGQRGSPATQSTCIPGGGDRKHERGSQCGHREEGEI